MDALSRLFEHDQEPVLLAAASDVLRPFGVTGWALTLIPTNAQEALVLLWDGWPEEWAGISAKPGFGFRNPATARNQHWISAEVRQSDLAPEPVGQALEDAAGRRFSDGLCIPIKSAVGLGSFWLAGDRIDPSPEVGRLAAVVAARLLTVLTNDVLEDSTDRLSPREKDVLSWIARGKTANEVAEILRISPHTVGEHLKHIRGKLSASNVVHAVVKALKSGQLSI